MISRELSGELSKQAELMHFHEATLLLLIYCMIINHPRIRCFRNFYGISLVCQ